MVQNQVFICPTSSFYKSRIGFGPIDHEKRRPRRPWRRYPL